MANKEDFFKLELVERIYSQHPSIIESEDNINSLRSRFKGIEASVKNIKNKTTKKINAAKQKAIALTLQQIDDATNNFEFEHEIYQPKNIRHFFDSLEHNLLFNGGFVETKLWSMCPCAKLMFKWREQFNIVPLCGQDKCGGKTQYFKKSDSLLQHLTRIGNNTNNPSGFLHFGTLIYLKELHGIKDKKPGKKKRPKKQGGRYLPRNLQSRVGISIIQGDHNYYEQETENGKIVNEKPANGGNQSVKDTENKELSSDDEELFGSSDVQEEDNQKGAATVPQAQENKEEEAVQNEREGLYEKQTKVQENKKSEAAQANKRVIGSNSTAENKKLEESSDVIDNKKAEEECTQAKEAVRSEDTQAKEAVLSEEEAVKGSESAQKEEADMAELQKKKEEEATRLEQGVEKAEVQGKETQAKEAEEMEEQQKNKKGEEEAAQLEVTANSDSLEIYEMGKSMMKSISRSIHTEVWEKFKKNQEQEEQQEFLESTSIHPPTGKIIEELMYCDLLKQMTDISKDNLRLRSCKVARLIFQYEVCKDLVTGEVFSYKNYPYSDGELEEHFL